MDDGADLVQAALFGSAVMVVMMPVVMAVIVTVVMIEIVAALTCMEIGYFSFATKNAVFIEVVKLDRGFFLQAENAGEIDDGFFGVCEGRESAEEHVAADAAVGFEFEDGHGGQLTVIGEE